MPRQFRHDFHPVPGAQHRSCDGMPEVVPPAQVDVAFFRDRANIALQDIARIQRNSTACMEDPLAVLPRAFRRFSSAAGIGIRRFDSRLLVVSTLPSYMRRCTCRTSPSKSDHLIAIASPMRSPVTARNNTNVACGSESFSSNRGRLRRTEHFAMNSSSRAVLTPWQLHSFAGVFFQPSVLHRIREYKTERDPHAANSAPAVFGRLRR